MSVKQIVVHLLCELDYCIQCYSPVQFLSSESRAKPLSQRQRKLPMVFLHLPFEHRLFIILHSFISTDKYRGTQTDQTPTMGQPWRSLPSMDENVPLRKGLPLMKSPLWEKPGPRGQSWAYRGVPFSGHSSHSGPQATPTEQQQASTRCLPEIGVPQRSSS